MFKRIYRQGEVQELAKYLHEKVCESISLTSGFFHPTVTAAHLSLFRDAKENYGDFLIVIVNGEKSCLRKYGKTLVSVEDRLLLVSELRMVSSVLEWDYDDVAEAISILKPTFFCKGGADRLRSNGGINPKEIEACSTSMVNLVDGVGGREKTRSNSDIIKKMNVLDWGSV